MAKLITQIYMISYTEHNARRFMKNLIATILFTGYRSQSQHKIDAKWHSLFTSECTFSPWRADAEFLEFKDKMVGYTLVDFNKQYLAYCYVKQPCKIGVIGGYLEMGVWRDALSALIVMAFEKYFMPHQKRQNT